MKILGVDVGFHNLALVLADCNGTDIHIEFAKKISLEDYKFIKSNDTIDLVPLMIEDYKHIFESADEIVIERQPLTGLTGIEVLIHYIHKDKAKLISPNSMHAFFGFEKLDYEQRKERTQKIALKYLEDNEYYMKLDRKHDIADAICMIVYQNYKNCMMMKKKKLEDNLVFEEFMYVKPSQSVLHDKPKEQK